MSQVVLTILALAVCSVSAAGYHLLKKIPVAGDYGWDYAGRGYGGPPSVHRTRPEVAVIDSTRTRLLGSRRRIRHARRGIAREFGRGFISESNPGSVVIFNLKTLAKIAEVPVGKDPNLIMVDHKTGRVFTADRGDKQVTAIDARSGKVVGTVAPFDGRTEHGASTRRDACSSICRTRVCFCESIRRR